jgi:hemoglobin
MSVLTVATLAACGGKAKGPDTANGTAADASASLYDRLGKKDAITAVVKDFVEERVAKDARINARFANTDIPHLEQMLTDQICGATGGPCKYTGKDMKTVHAGMNIKDADFNALVEDLVKSLNTNNVPPGAQQMLLNALAPLQNDIVQVPGPRQAPPAGAGGGQTAPSGGGGPTPIARDGRSLAGEPPSTQAAFRDLWGDQAAVEWAAEHNAQLGAGP